METAENREWWKAVLERDCRLDGVFVYAVRSTGVYCRPSCGARKPKQDQVSFFTSAEGARSAGFRPCRRCLPDESGSRNHREETARRLCRFIEEYDSPDRPLTLAVMSDYMKLSPYHLQRTFRQVMGVSPREYAEGKRVARLKELVKEGKDITGALYEAGYGSSSRLYEGAARRLGMTPGAYKRGGKGMRIGYTIVDCPLGRLLVAATDKGVSAISIGASDEELETALRDEYPSADIVRDRVGLGQYVSGLVSYLEGSGSLPNLPRDVRVTAFQARVYEALVAIPRGSVRTYREVAEVIGEPNAARAVGSACAKNPTSLIIPCHRVVRTDGNMGGYRWGIERKRALLEIERESSGEGLFEEGAGI